MIDGLMRGPIVAGLLVLAAGGADAALAGTPNTEDAHADYNRDGVRRLHDVSPKLIFLNRA